MRHEYTEAKSVLSISSPVSETFLTHRRHSANVCHVDAEWTNEGRWKGLMNTTPAGCIKSFHGYRSPLFLGRYVGIALLDHVSVMSNLQGKNSPNCFLNWFQNPCGMRHSAAPRQYGRGPVLPYPSQHLVLSVLVKCNYSLGTTCGSNVHFPNT